MNQSVSIVIGKSVMINGNITHTSIAANCAPADVDETTKRLLATMAEAVTLKLDHKAP